MDHHYKFTFKIYANKRLNFADVHGIEMSPLYIQTIYLNKPDYFKSYYFGLYKKPKYREIFNSIEVSFSKLVENIESDLINYILDKHHAKIKSLTIFRTLYKIYSIDLIDDNEKDCFNAISDYFKGADTPVIAEMSTHLPNNHSAYKLMLDLKKLLSPDIYKHLESFVCEKSLYLPLYHFMLTKKKLVHQILTVKDWEALQFTSQYEKFLSSRFPHIDSKSHLKRIEAYLAY